jgi:hypothetical protein
VKLPKEVAKVSERIVAAETPEAIKSRPAVTTSHFLKLSVEFFIDTCF